MAGTESGGGGQKRATRRDDEVEEVETTTDAKSDVAERQGKLSDDVDAILDEIDDVLEENAEEFIRGYVQKGGE
jgi:ubiquitin-like protein Pup